MRDDDGRGVEVIDGRGRGLELARSRTTRGGRKGATLLQIGRAKAIACNMNHLLRIRQYRSGEDVTTAGQSGTILVPLIRVDR